MTSILKSSSHRKYKIILAIFVILSLAIIAILATTTVEQTQKNEQGVDEVVEVHRIGGVAAAFFSFLVIVGAVGGWLFIAKLEHKVEKQEFENSRPKLPEPITREEAIKKARDIAFNEHWDYFVNIEDNTTEELGKAGSEVFSISSRLVIKPWQILTVIINKNYPERVTCKLNVDKTTLRHAKRAIANTPYSDEVPKKTIKRENIYTGAKEEIEEPVEEIGSYPSAPPKEEIL